MKKPLHLLLGLLLALAALGPKARAQSILRVAPDSVLVQPRQFWDVYAQSTHILTFRGIHLQDAPLSTIREVRFHIPVVGFPVEWNPPFLRAGNVHSYTILNDSTLRVEVMIDVRMATSYLDLEVLTDRDTVRMNKALKAQHRYFTESYTLQPAEGHPGQTLDVVASNLTLGGQATPTVGQISSTLHIDLQDGWNHISTNFSTQLSPDHMVANLTIPSNAKPGCYDVYIHSGGNCQVLNDAFCILPGTVTLPGRIQGTVYYDSAQNCLKEWHERGLEGIIIQALPGPYYARTDREGKYTIDVPLDTFTVNQIPSRKIVSVCQPQGYTVIVDERINPHYDFGDTVALVGNLSISMHQWRMRPGFVSWLKYWIYNTGELPMGGLLYAKMDTNLHYVSAVPAPIAIRHDTLVFQLPTMQPSSEFDIVITNSLRPDHTLLGDTTINSGWIEGNRPETNYQDNQTHEISWIGGSWDPNDKAVWPDKQFFVSDSVLSYRIRFQNTGTDTAFFIVIRDTLAPHLDISSIVDKGASHPHTLSIRGENVLEWRFMNILLPDSNVNEPESHGFVEFSLKPKAGLPMGTRIDNRAGIYFDFNPPVMTNYASTTLSSPVKVGEAVGTNGVTVYPNPLGSGQSILRVGGKADFEGAEFQLLDVTGRRVATSAIRQGAAALERSRLKAGLYTFRIIQKGKPASTGRLVLE